MEVKHMNSPAGRKRNKAESTMYKRVLSYLSLAAYMQASSALKSGDQEKAGYFIRIYALVDPTNAEAPYLEAGWFAKQGKGEEAMKSLSKAVDLGFTDLKRFESDPAFKRYQGRQDYKTILSRMRIKK